MEKIDFRTGIYLLSIGFAVAIAMLHWLLYLFYPRQRANLFFSIFAIAVAGRELSADVLRPTATSGNMATLIAVAKELSIAVAVFAFVLFLYSAFAPKIGLQFPMALGSWALL